MKISVVIPTYNRNEQLSKVIDYLLDSDLNEFEAVEIIVVDDGSPIPAQCIVESKSPNDVFEFSYIRQNNAGPAEARNNGLRHAKHEIVLFVDDDVLVMPDVLRKHILAHEKFPKSVIFGPYPYLVPEVETAEYRFLQNLIMEGLEKIEFQDGFAKVDTVASGNLSVEKAQFKEGLYEVGLSVPVAEEYALIDSLRKKGITTYLGRNICAWHLQPPTIEDCCNQNYKYGLGIAEVAVKRPEVLGLQSLGKQFSHNLSGVGSDGLTLRLKKHTRNLVSRSPLRGVLLNCARLLTKARLPDSFLFWVFRLTIGVFSAAGVRDGYQIFKKKKNNAEDVPRAFPFR